MIVKVVVAIAIANGARLALVVGSQGLSNLSSAGVVPWWIWTGVPGRAERNARSAAPSERQRAWLWKLRARTPANTTTHPRDSDSVTGSFVLDMGKFEPTLQ